MAAFRLVEESALKEQVVRVLLQHGWTPRRAFEMVLEARHVFGTSSHALLMQEIFQCLADIIIKET